MVLYSFLKTVNVEVYSVTFSETKMNTENRWEIDAGKYG